MANVNLGESESRFADLIWENEPVSSSKLVKLAAEKLDWKKSTVHTVLRRLCDKGIFQNDDGTVTSLLDREEFYSLRSQQFVDGDFCGSLPNFIAAFTSGRKLSRREVKAIRQIIDEAQER